MMNSEGLLMAKMVIDAGPRVHYSEIQCIPLVRPTDIRSSRI